MATVAIGVKPMTLTLKAAQIEAGAISTRNSKMPGSSFAVSAKACNVGGKLVNVKGSTCSKCYAIKLQNMRPSVNIGWTNNLDRAVKLIDHNPEQWAQFMAFQINKAAQKTGENFHRWFDAGDLQSLAMLKAIVRVCELTPNVSHWLPTREAKIVRAFATQGALYPDNLVVRVSSVMIDDKPIAGYSHTSTVHRKGGEASASKGNAPASHVCPASQQGNACGDCRACWRKDVASVSYPLH